MSIGVLIVLELALILVALGFLLSSQSNSMVSNVVAGKFIVKMVPKRPMRGSIACDQNQTQKWKRRLTLFCQV